MLQSITKMRFWSCFKMTIEKTIFLKCAQIVILLTVFWSLHKFLGQFLASFKTSCIINYLFHVANTWSISTIPNIKVSKRYKVILTCVNFQNLYSSAQSFYILTCCFWLSNLSINWCSLEAFCTCWSILWLAFT